MFQSENKREGKCYKKMSERTKKTQPLILISDPSQLLPERTGRGKGREEERRGWGRTTDTP